MNNKYKNFIDETRPEKKLNNVLVWHDEKRTSWTYCDRFKITKWEAGVDGTIYALYRIQHSLGGESDTANWVANFKTLETAKVIATIIKINECKKEITKTTIKLNRCKEE